ncbi:hypothetical protein [Actinomyces glycerinitolerans]|uniref:Uncharacterized protein n=1 Tax=Actinomyces glycerinitolerans TaxID=1892869 RepID=A0A1M4RZ77_9ACTO|nr:hypothetical protein [Actinomyces glycerinitolerans]SHE25210.1 Hypothetical protein ACGLYG10_1426 [Actinomyces glycerinitolerans]
MSNEYSLTGPDGPFGADYLRLLHEAAALEPMPPTVAEALTGEPDEIITAMADTLDDDGTPTPALTWQTLWPAHREQAKRRIAEALEHLALHGVDGAGAVTLNQVICHLGHVKETSDLDARNIIRDIAGRGTLTSRSVAALTGRPKTEFPDGAGWEGLTGRQQAAVVRRVRHAVRLLQDEGGEVAYKTVIYAVGRRDFDKLVADLYTRRIMGQLSGTGKVRTSTAEKVCGTPEGELTRWGPRMSWGWIDPAWRDLARERIHHTVQVMLNEGLDPTYRAVAARIINHPPAGLPHA